MPNIHYLLCSAMLSLFMITMNSAASSDLQNKEIIRFAIKQSQEKERKKILLKRLKKQIEVCKKKRKPLCYARIANLYEKAAAVSNKLGEHTEAANYCEEALKIRFKYGFKKELIKSLVNCGLIYYVQRKYALSIAKNKIVLKQVTLENLEKENEVNKKYYLQLLFKARYNIGSAYWETGKYKKALAQYLEAERLMPMIDMDDVRRSEFYDALGFTYFQCDNFEKSIQYFSKAARIREQKKGTYLDTLITWKILGDVYLADNQIQKARKYYQKVLNFTKNCVGKKNLIPEVQKNILNLDSAAAIGLKITKGELAREAIKDFSVIDEFIDLAGNKRQRNEHVLSNPTLNAGESAQYLLRPHISLAGLFLGLVSTTQLRKNGNKEKSPDE